MADMIIEQFGQDLEVIVVDDRIARLWRRAESFAISGLTTSLALSSKAAHRAMILRLPIGIGASKPVWSADC